MGRLYVKIKDQDNVVVVTSDTKAGTDFRGPEGKSGYSPGS